MGREVRCLVRSGGDEAEAKALLETDEVIVRSPFRLKVPRSDITGTAVDGDRLTIDHAGGPPLVLELGAKEAARWAHDIANPKTLADKLGVKPGQRVRLVGDVDPELVGRRRGGRRRGRRTSSSCRSTTSPTWRGSPSCARRSPPTARSG